jgi:diguanylate cyclase (GGDEF)-like protein
MCVIFLLRAARARPAGPRGAYVTLATAVTAAVIALAGVALVHGLVDSPGLRAVVAAGVGFGAGTLVLAAGVLMLPAVVVRGGRWARVLDGLLLTAAVFYIAWTAFLERLHLRTVGDGVPLRLDARCVAFAVPTVLIVCSLGVMAVSAAHLTRARTPALGVCVGAALYCAGAVLLVYASGAGLPTRSGGQFEPIGGAGGSVALGTCALVAGCLAMAVGARRSELLPAPPAPPGVREAGLSTIAVGFSILATIYRLATGRDLDTTSVVTCVFIAGFLVLQQGLARRELRRYADRLEESEQHFRDLAHTDALTGLANRRELLRTLQIDAVGGPPCVLLAIDLDGFKNINDIRGHDVGDAVLVEVARRLRSNVRPGDCAARLGGDEFAVLMWARPSEAQAVAERILSVLNRPYELVTGTVFVSASIGLAGCLEADSIDSLLRNADLALRFAKQAGKNRVESYDIAYDELVRRRTELEHEMRGAVERGELMLVYQPVVDLADGRVAGVEALLRWHHPTLGTVPPAEFIPLAEETGLIHGIGAFVVHEACHQLSRWLADGHEIWLSVNASVRELHTPEYAVQIADVLRTHRVPADRLVIEVTEHAVALDVDQLVERLAVLRSSGVRLALDDFGAGYSSLNILRTLPVDALKIDRALLRQEGEPGSTPLVDVVVDLGERLALDVVAEGVATPAQQALLEHSGCRYAQGELFGDAMPAERVEALFRPPVPTTDDPIDAVGAGGAAEAMSRVE